MEQGGRAPEGPHAGAPLPRCQTSPQPIRLERLVRKRAEPSEGQPSLCSGCYLGETAANTFSAVGHFSDASLAHPGAVRTGLAPFWGSGERHPRWLASYRRPGVTPLPSCEGRRLPRSQDQRSLLQHHFGVKSPPDWLPRSACTVMKAISDGLLRHLSPGALRSAPPGPLLARVGNNRSEQAGDDSPLPGEGLRPR